MFSLYYLSEHMEGKGWCIYRVLFQRLGDAVEKARILIITFWTSCGVEQRLTWIEQAGCGDSWFLGEMLQEVSKSQTVKSFIGPNQHLELSVETEETMEFHLESGILHFSLTHKEVNDVF